MRQARTAPTKRWLARAAIVAGHSLLPLPLLSTGPAGAGEVTAGGALDVEISGFARFLTIGGDVDNLRLDDSSTELDFFNDTEVHVTASRTDEEIGLEYGATVEFEADTNSTENSDETYLFLRAGWGELRLGDEDGTADNDGLGVSAADIAAGTDGLESDQLEILFAGVKTYEPINTNDATKVRYESPSFGGFEFGASFTPSLDGLNSGDGNGDTVATTDNEAQNVVEGGVAYAGGVAGLDVKAAITGLVGDLKNEGEAGGDDYWAAQAGAVVSYAGFQFAGSYLTQEAGAVESDAITAGLGTQLGPVELSLNYGQTLESDGIAANDGADELDKPWTVILSATVGLLPGLTLDGDVAYFDNDVKDGDGPSGGDNGWQGLGRLGLAF